MHSKLLHDVICRQAGTLSKAALEAVMNSIDAGATKCEITVTGVNLSISDDGKGFRTRGEIEQFFEVFGQPHAESEGKVYGSFRMGRGQLMAFGRNIWTSGAFRMDVDIKNKGLDYLLQSNEPPTVGCKVEIHLYNPLRPVEVVDMVRDFGRLVQFAQIPILVNGRLMSEAASTKKWPLETDEGYMKIDVGGNTGLKVYNLGVHVADLSSYTYGCSGTIVSKQQLKVNFARNDIMADDPVWKKIQSTIRKLVKVGTKGKKKLTASERAVILRNLISGEAEWNDFSGAKLLTDCTGRGWSIDQLARGREKFGEHNYSNHGFFTFATRDSDEGDRIMQHQLGLVLDESLIELIGAMSPASFFHEAFQFHEDYHWAFDKVLKMTYVPIATLSAKIEKHGHINIHENQWTAREKMLMKTLDSVKYHVAASLRQSGVETGARRICLGECDIANGWTDGSSYIVFNRPTIARIKPNAGGWMEAILIMLHEYCHNEADVGDHVHDEEFYKLYHDCSQRLGYICQRAATNYLETLRKAGKRLPVQVERGEALAQEAQQIDSSEFGGPSIDADPEPAECVAAA